MEGGRDYVMAKLGETIHPMKESFIVAYLMWDGVEEENTVVPKEILEYQQKHGIVVRNRKKQEVKMKEKNDTSSIVPPKTLSISTGSLPITTSGVGPQSSKSEKCSDIQKNGSNKVSNDVNTTKTSSSDQQVLKTVAVEKVPSNPSIGAPKPTPVLSTTDSKSSSEPLETKSVSTSNVVSIKHRDGKLTAMARKRDADGKEKICKPVTSKQNTASYASRTLVKDSRGRLVKVVDDDLEEMDCEFLNNRQLFLNLCQGNHYQFDQVRRAKHTSMMVLWHLHNRDAPKFVQQCAVCSQEILIGKRYHCMTCTDYDQCQECVNNPKTPRHMHPLKPIAVATGQQNEFTDEQRKERQRVIQLHMQLLLHAATCVSPKCPSANCNKMKGLLKHGAQCQIKATGGCHVCKRIWGLLQIHARQCKETTCRVPNCVSIRERFRQLTKQQQAMDDRRRQEMNRTYRGMSRS